MITARFERHKGAFVSARLSGHAGYAAHGSDIVCASATSALQLCCNGVTEVLKVPATVDVEEDTITLELPPDAGCGAQSFLEALHLHMTLLEQDYPDNLTTTVLEV